MMLPGVKMNPQIVNRIIQILRKHLYSENKTGGENIHLIVAYHKSTSTKNMI